jgi:ribosomal protein S18 acetylase RimI-like enzyme
MFPATRWLQATDLDALVALDRECFGAHGWPRSTFETFLRLAGRAGFVAEPGGKIRGYALYCIDPSYLRGGIARLVVHPALRRRGLGSGLLHRVMDRMDHIPAVVAVAPDTALAYHLFLAARDFRAVEVKRGLFGEADGYIFVNRDEPI